MKITFLLPHLRMAGGVRVALMYAELLAKRGHDVTVVTNSPPTLRARVRNAIRRNHVPWLPGFGFRVVYATEFDESYIPDADIIIATAWQTARAANGYGSRKGAKFYLIQHYESLYHGDASLVDATYRLPFRKIVISQWLETIMHEKFGVEAHRLLTPVDDGLFHPVGTDRPAAPVRILLLHHSFRWKGTDIGVQVTSALKKKYPGGLELVLFGTREGMQNIPADEYHENPPQGGLAGIYSSCGIYLCPSEWEGLGLPGMEAMACKSTLVTFDTGGSRDYATGGKTAFVAEHGNANDLQRKLEHAIFDAQLRMQVAENGYRFIKSLPTWEDQTRQLESLLHSA